MTFSNRLEAFTLIEVLISLALSGMLIVILNQQIQNSFQFDSRIKNQMEYRLDIESVFDFISADINSASYLPDGRKSLSVRRIEDEVHLIIKRFGVSPDTKQISGMDIVWKFGESGISKSVNTQSSSFNRLYSRSKINAQFQEIDKKVINLIIVTEQFTKSKLFKL